MHNKASTHCSSATVWSKACSTPQHHLCVSLLHEQSRLTWDEPSGFLSLPHTVPTLLYFCSAHSSSSFQLQSSAKSSGRVESRGLVLYQCQHQTKGCQELNTSHRSAWSQAKKDQASRGGRRLRSSRAFPHKAMGQVGFSYRDMELSIPEEGWRGAAMFVCWVRRR